MAKIKEEDIVLCTVKKIDGTSVFVEIDGNGEGTIITSEIAPGRIRNLRDYVVPNKRIACKVLRIDSSGNIHLSLRRVTSKERKKVLEDYQKEKNSISILRTVLKEKAEGVITKIKVTSSVLEFLQNCKENPKELSQYMDKTEAEKVCKILVEKDEKREVEVKKEIMLKTKLPNGIEIIKSILSTCQGSCHTTYIAAGRYQIKIKSQDYKQANTEISLAVQNIESLAKEKKVEFQVIEAKK
ncbi:MAG: S1 RNA-binding domain-containing protein [archaeon]